MKLEGKKLELFSGTGGVGKTTLACSRAIFLSSLGNKVLLITIDPAKRLKQILNLNEVDSGQVHPIDLSIFNIDNIKEGSLDAMLMNPHETLKKIVKKERGEDKIYNHILQTLLRPYGGMNEIMSVIELHHQLESDQYDYIILDTPPGKNFLDFLDSSQKIQLFFNKHFIDVFNYLNNKRGVKKSAGLLKKVISSAMNKLLSYLQKVTGEAFIEEFIDAVSTVYDCKKYFLEALKFQENLKDSSLANWFIVTSVEQQKIHDAILLRHKASNLMDSNCYFIINKCINDQLDNWQPKTAENQIIKESLLAREKSIKEVSKQEFSYILEFIEVLSPDPLVHINQLIDQWNQENRATI